MHKIIANLNTGTGAEAGIEHHEINCECVAIEVLHQFHHLQQQHQQ